MPEETDAGTLKQGEYDTSAVTDVGTKGVLLTSLCVNCPFAAFRVAICTPTF